MTSTATYYLADKNVQVGSMFKEKSKNEEPPIKLDITTQKEGGVPRYLSNGSDELPKQ